MHQEIKTVKAHGSIEQSNNFARHAPIASGLRILHRSVPEK
jgi:hypothetical protein